MIMKKIGCVGKNICKGLWKGMKETKVEIITLSLVVIPALLVQETSHANTAASVTSITGPIETLEGLLTGTVAKAGSTIAIAVGGLGWAMGTEQQITKFATRAAVGGGIAVGGGNVLHDIVGDGQASGCLF